MKIVEEYNCDTRASIISALENIEDNFIIQITRSTVRLPPYPIIHIPYASFISNLSIFLEEKTVVKFLICCETDFRNLTSYHSASHLFSLGFLIIIKDAKGNI